MTKKLALGILAILVAGLFALLAVAADQPLSADDITLLLLAGSPTKTSSRSLNNGASASR